MTALDRARSWFLEPADAPATPSTLADESPSPPAASDAPPPLADASGPPPPAAASWPDAPVATSDAHSPAAPSSLITAGPSSAPPRDVSTAAVLGRPGEAEPVAASVALALTHGVRGRAAAVAVLGGTAAPAAGGTPAARRLATRLQGLGLSAQPRGRLVWVALPPGEAQVAARRVPLVGAPAVLVVAAPRTAEVDQLLAEQDLIVVVAADPDGPLARLALAAPDSTPVVVVRPLPRGPARALARAGVRPARSIREALAGVRP